MTQRITEDVMTEEGTQEAPGKPMEIQKLAGGGDGGDGTRCPDLRPW
jgi:hypothetical protein